jgi:hypothetical protein
MQTRVRMLFPCGSEFNYFSCLPLHAHAWILFYFQYSLWFWAFQLPFIHIVSGCQYRYELTEMNWNPDTMCMKGSWNDQNHNDNTTRMTKYKFKYSDWQPSRNGQCVLTFSPFCISLSTLAETHPFLNSLHFLCEPKCGENNFSPHQNV